MEMIGRHGNWSLREVAFLWTLLPSWHKWKQNRCCVHCHRQKSYTSVPRGGRNGRGGVFVCVLKWESGLGPEGTGRFYHLCPILLLALWFVVCASPGEGWTDPGAQGVGVPYHGAAWQSWACSAVCQGAPEELGFGLWIESGGWSPRKGCSLKCLPTYHPAMIASAMFPKWTPPDTAGVLCF